MSSRQCLRALPSHPLPLTEVVADLVIALDVPTAAAAVRLVDALGAEATWFKVGPVLFVTDGPSLVREIVSRGKLVFLDLKWHDIPSTVAGAVAAAGGLGVSLATVHLAGGRRMLEAATSARDGAGPRLVGVGVLTSLEAGDYADIVSRPVTDLSEEQERLVRLAVGSGLDGFVAAAGEVPRLRRAAGPAALLVTPGIRRPGEAAGDQRRTASPAEAVRAGADLLVVGRPVTEASRPLEVVRAIRREMGA